MKFFAMFMIIFSLMVAPRATAEDSVFERASKRAENTHRAQVAVNAGHIVLGGVAEWRRENTQREWIRAQKEIQLAQIEAEREARANYEANRAYETAARTGRPGSGSARNGQVSGRLDPPPQSQSAHDWSSNFRMPQQRHGSSGPMVR